MAIPSDATHEALAKLADENAGRPIVPVASTSPSVFRVLTLGHLNFYLREKREEAVNTNALWTFASPPNLGRTKIEALRQFAIEEVYEKQIAGRKQELEKFEEDIAETWRHEVKVISGDEKNPNPLFGPSLGDDDVEYVVSLILIQVDVGVLKNDMTVFYTKTWGCRRIRHMTSNSHWRK